MVAAAMTIRRRWAPLTRSWRRRSVTLHAAATLAPSGQYGRMESRRWWVFDRPLSRDWLFVAGLALGTFGPVVTLLGRVDFGSVALLLALPSGVLTAGIFGGTLREFLRGRRRSAG